MRYPVPAPDHIIKQAARLPIQPAPARPRETIHQSPAFQNWFGDSKVVDANGTPLVVYHGTRAEGAISAFDIGKAGKTDSGWLGRGFYFGNKDTADAYAGHREFEPGHIPQGGAVYPVYLALKNPAILQDSERNDGPRTMVRELLDLADEATSDEVRLGLLEAGYDGVIYQRWSPRGNGYREYVAVHPEQIKSAIGNSGRFDPTCADITDSIEPVTLAAGAGSHPDGKATIPRQPSMHLVSTKVDQAATPAFQEWFGDSAVVNEHGKPLVVYHGTTADVSAFNPAFAGSDGVGFSAPAYFATDNKALASDYAQNKFNRNIADAMRGLQAYKNTHPGAYGEEYELRYQAVRDAFATVKDGRELGGGANVMPLYMALKDPLVIDAAGKYFMQVMPDVIARAVADGCDGAIVRNVVDHASPASEYPVTVYIALQPEQIKSAIGNSGRFDPTCADLTDSQPRLALAAGAGEHADSSSLHQASEQPTRRRMRA